MLLQRSEAGAAGARAGPGPARGWAVAAGAAGGLGEHPLAAGALERVDLQARQLVGGGDAGMAEQVARAGDGRTTCDTPGCVTLVADTGSGRPAGESMGAMAAVAERTISSQISDVG
jgi:hypothetical protein